MKTEDLILQLSKDLSPVKPIGNIKHRFAVVLLINIFVLILGVVFWFMRKGEFNLPMGRSLVEAMLVLAVFLLAGWQATSAMSPHNARARIRKSEWLLLGLWIAVIGLAFAHLYNRSPNEAVEALGYRTWACPEVIFSIAIPAALAMVFYFKRGSAIYPRHIYLSWALAAFSLGVFGLAFICPWNDPLHELLWHVIPALLGTGVLIFIAGLYPKWFT